MLRRKPSSPPIDPIEQDFKEALRRLEEGLPTNRLLKSVKEKGRLKITISNVALEAGRSRTLIALEKCRYPLVRELIKQAKSGKSEVPTTHTELIGKLRADVAELKIQKDLYQAEATAHLLARIRAEREAKREKETSERLRKELARTGTITLLRPKETKGK